MKLLILNYEFPPLGGGAANANFYLFKELSTRPHLKIDLITSSVSKFRIEKFSSNITIHYLDIGKNNNLHNQSIVDLLRYSAKCYRYARKLISRNNFQLIHAFFGVPCGYIAKRLGLPYIISLRGSDVPFHTPKYWLLDKLFLQKLSKHVWHKSKCTVVNSIGLKEEAESTTADLPFEVIYNGVDTEKFRPHEGAARELFRAEETFVVITTGRLAPHKGPQYLLEAVALIPEAMLVFVGDGPMKNELESQANAKGINALFTGKLSQEEMIPYLQHSDVFVLPSLNEGMSNSMLEAMAVGLPIVATNVGGSGELIKGNGFIVEKGKASAIHDALKKYHGNEALIKVHGAKSREMALGLSWKNMADQYVVLYEKMTQPV